MFDMMKPLATWDDMWQNMIALTEYPFAGKNLKDIGLRKLITRPHNIVNVTDPKTKKVIEQRLEVVTTPFKKGDVKVTVSGNTLTVECGNVEDEATTEQENEEPREDFLYKGISEQYYTFSLKLSDQVDKSRITAKNEDGVLKVTLPFKEVESGDVAQIEVK